MKQFIYTLTVCFFPAGIGKPELVAGKPAIISGLPFFHVLSSAGFAVQKFTTDKRRYYFPGQQYYGWRRVERTVCGPENKKPGYQWRYHGRGAKSAG
jgi:hypothetical protein